MSDEAVKDLDYFELENPSFENSYSHNGQIYWYASYFLSRLGYDQYSPTIKPLQKALQVCMSTNIDTSDNFREEWREIDGKRIKDFKLSRFACYLVAMNSDIKKPQVAKAQAYFAAFTATMQEFIKSQEDVERISLRTEITEQERTLMSTASIAGINKNGYALFQYKGYLGLYNMPLDKIKRLKGVPEKEPLFDYMGAEELGANIFRITQTNAKIKRERIKGQQNLEEAAQRVGETVRKAIRETGGTMPEDLQPEVNIKKIKSELKKTNKEFKKSDKKLIDKNSEN
ncbi:MAG: hypothetical protein FWD87_08025 [Spirochaetaceae bacterium]|nr:hypothetical protein [Spirochaetaceae bacterium]